MQSLPSFAQAFPDVPGERAPAWNSNTLPPLRTIAPSPEGWRAVRAPSRKRSRDVAAHSAHSDEDDLYNDDHRPRAGDVDADGELDADDSARYHHHTLHLSPSRVLRHSRVPVHTLPDVHEREDMDALPRTHSPIQVKVEAVEPDDMTMDDDSFSTTSYISTRGGGLSSPVGDRFSSSSRTHSNRSSVYYPQEDSARRTSQTTFERPSSSSSFRSSHTPREPELDVTRTKRRRVTVSGSAPTQHLTHHHGRFQNPPLPPVIAGFDMPSEPHAFEQLRSALSVKQQQQALIEQRRSSLIAPSIDTDSSPAPAPVQTRPRVHRSHSHSLATPNAHFVFAEPLVGDPSTKPSKSGPLSRQSSPRQRSGSRAVHPRISRPPSSSSLQPPSPALPTPAEVEVSLEDDEMPIDTPIMRRRRGDVPTGTPRKMLTVQTGRPSPANPGPGVPAPLRSAPLSTDSRSNNFPQPDRARHPPHWPTDSEAPRNVVEFTGQRIRRSVAVPLAPMPPSPSNYRFAESSVANNPDRARSHISDVSGRRMSTPVLPSINIGTHAPDTPVSTTYPTPNSSFSSTRPTVTSLSSITTSTSTDELTTQTSKMRLTDQIAELVDERVKAARAHDRQEIEALKHKMTILEKQLQDSNRNDCDPEPHHGYYQREGPCQ